MLKMDTITPLSHNTGNLVQAHSAALGAEEALQKPNVTAIGKFPLPLSPLPTKIKRWKTLLQLCSAQCTLCYVVT